jgi:hypothetical protein
MGDRTDSEPTGTIRSQPIAVEVTSVLAEQEDPSNFRDIKDAIAAPQATPGRSRWLWPSAAGMLVLALIAVVFRYAGRRRPAPQVWASGEVDRIESEYQSNAINLGQAYVQLSSVIRTFLEAQLSIPASSQSSEELWSELGRASCPPSVSERLQRFMADADKLKFSGRLDVAREQAESPFDAIRAVINQTSGDQNRAARLEPS